MKPPTISIVVCTRNRAAMLRQALASLTALKTDGLFTYDIVVVDNGSTDHTPDVVAQTAAASARAGGAPIGYCVCPEPGIVAARNCGIAQARGEWIAFFDDDQLAEPNWLLELFRGAQRYACPVVGGTVRLALPDDAPQPLHPTVRMLLGEAVHGPAPLPYGGRLTPGCGNLLVAREVFAHVGTFQRTIDGRGEDTDLFNRIERARLPAMYIPTAVVWHLTPHERLAEDYLLTLAQRMGRGVAQRQAAVLGRPRLALLTLGKALRLALIQWPSALAARYLGTPQQWLGRRCLVAINTSFLRAAVKELSCASGSASLAAKTLETTMPPTAPNAALPSQGVRQRLAVDLPARHTAANPSVPLQGSAPTSGGSPLPDSPPLVAHPSPTPTQTPHGSPSTAIHVPSATNA
jgi:GT2 family glycosyltransferase